MWQWKLIEIYSGPHYNYTIKANYFKGISFTMLKISIIKLTAEMLPEHVCSAHLWHLTLLLIDRIKWGIQILLLVPLDWPNFFSSLHNTFFPPRKVKICSACPLPLPWQLVYHTQLTFSFTVSILSVEASSECCFPRATIVQSSSVVLASFLEFFFCPIWSWLDL